jgi:hypothetical protein
MKRLLKLNNDFWTNERSLKALLIYLLIALFTWMPLSEFRWGYVITDILFNLILLSGVYAVLTWWRRQVLFISLALLAGLFRILSLLFDGLELVIANNLITLAFLIMLSFMVGKHILKDGPVNFYRIEGSIVVYLMIGIVGAFLYSLIEELSPGSFSFNTPGSNSVDYSFPQFLYFSFITQTTLGYGDMVPTGALAKSVVIFHGMAGMLYPVIMIARLVSLEIEHTRAARGR